MSIVSKRLTCLTCGGELNKSQIKFCCKSCAAIYNNKLRTTTTKGKTKNVKCIKCGKEIEVSIHSSKSSWICEDCKRGLKLIKLVNSKKDKLDTISINSLINQISKDNLKICIYTPLESHIKNCDECFFYKNDICKKNISGIAQIINNIRKIKLFQFDETSIGTSKIIDEYFRIKNLLYHLYNDMKLSGEDIDKLAEKHIWYNIGLKVFKLQSRNFPDAITNAIIQNKIINYANNQYKTEWHKTWDGREVFLRSSYETDYANELDKNHIHYEVENLRIKYLDTQLNRWRCAIPDFYIPSTNTIVEIKSNWTYDEHNMRDKVREYYNLGYNFKLILDHEEVSFNI